MNITELPIEMQQQLAADRLALKTINNPYFVRVHNPQGTRFLEARRVCRCWQNERGAYMPFGGGSYWTIRYGVVAWKKVKDILGGGYSVELADGKLYGAAANGTKIPRDVHTKADVLKLIQAIGIFKAI